MARSVDELSVDEIRQRYLEGRELVSARVLNILQRDPRQGVRRLHAALKKRYAWQREERLRLDAMRHFELVLWKSGVRDIAGVANSSAALPAEVGHGDGRMPRTGGGGNDRRRFHGGTGRRPALIALECR